VPTIGVVSPGAMGSAVGAALARGGARVVATLAGRSHRTAGLGERAHLELLPDLASIVREADVVLSIVPPEAAVDVVSAVAAAAAENGAHPLVADLNAVAPATIRAAVDLAARAGCDLVDGSISGPPPWRPGTTRIYLSGERAAEVAELPFRGVDTIVVGPHVGSASAVKMSTGSVYKGTSALLVQALLAARANGVLDVVLDDLRRGAPELASGVEKRVALAASKSDRYVGEMREIAATQAEAGLTPALFDAMAEIYASVSRTALAQTSPEDARTEKPLEDVLDGLR
jgi:3-hydroxyisobutyrate dehydrogenase-like beta-hydroxyacid dehydrogenase